MTEKEAEKDDAEKEVAEKEAEVSEKEAEKEDAEKEVAEAENELEKDVAEKDAPSAGRSNSRERGPVLAARRLVAASSKFALAPRSRGTAYLHCSGVAARARIRN